MTAADGAFAGSIPALYDRYLGPLLFAPYAADIAARAAALGPRRILETAAGTGIVTEALARALPEAEIVATDLNQAMLDVAAGPRRRAQCQLPAGRRAGLPFPDASFDLVLSQFGVMFFPDRVAAYREARRVLKPGGRFLFNAWDRIEMNPVTATVGGAIAGLVPERRAESFYRRVPFGYHDTALIEADLREAGFTEVAVETVALTSRGLRPRRRHRPHPGHAAPRRDRGAWRRPRGSDRSRRRRARPLDGRDVPMSARVVLAR